MGDELLSIWNDLYVNDSPPDIDVFLDMFLLLSDVKDILDISESYSPAWNDTLMTIDELQALSPSVRRIIFLLQLAYRNNIHMYFNAHCCFEIGIQL